MPGKEDLLLVTSLHLHSYHRNLDGNELIPLRQMWDMEWVFGRTKGRSYQTTELIKLAPHVEIGDWVAEVSIGDNAHKIKSGENIQIAIYCPREKRWELYKEY